MSVAIGIAIVLDVGVVLSLALLAVWALRRRSAAVRHAVLVAGLLAAGAVPVLEVLVPAWEVPLAWRGGADDASAMMALTSEVVTLDAGGSTAASPGDLFSWPEAIGVVWLGGSLVVLAGLIVSLLRLARETRRCTVVRSGPWRDEADRLSARGVTLLQSDSPSLLLTWGHRHPRILLPSGSDRWPQERRAVVLAHELAHIGRGDWALQLAAESVRAVYWFHPLAWIACRRLRIESEYACDDVVLDTGVEPTRYAAHLLDVARQAIAGRDSWASAPAVANPSTLERRISAMLHPTGSRTPLTRRARAGAAAVALVLAAPIAAVAITEPAPGPVSTRAVADVVLAAPVPASAPDAVPATPAPRPRPAPPDARAAAPAQQAPGAFSGVLSDSSGGVLPGVVLTLTGAQSGVVYDRTSDGLGRFAFPDLPPGPYTLVAELPGFRTLKVELDLGSAERLEQRLEMSIGSLMETLTVLCAPAGAALRLRDVMASPRRALTPPLFPRAQGTPGVQDVPASAQTPVRVGGNIRAPRKVTHVAPTCPVLPPADGTVAILEAVIGPEGDIAAVSVLREPSPAGLAEAAVEAVRQWTFTPTLLNNVAVPVIMTVTVVFERD